MGAVRDQRTTPFYSAAGVTFGEFSCVHGHRAGRRSRAGGNIVVFPKSCGVVRQAGADPVVGTPCTSVLYNAGVEYECRALGEDGVERTNFVEFDTDVLAGTPELAPEGVVFPTNECEIPTRAYVLQLAIEGAARRPDADPLRMEEGIFRALSLVLDAARRAPRARAPGRRQVEYARWTAEVVARTYRERRTLAEISERVGVSRFHLCTLFRAAYGTSIHAYRSRLRLRSALVELVEPGSSLSRISAGHGYATQSHFQGAFRRAFGMTPGHARAGLGGRRAVAELLGRLPPEAMPS